MTIGLEALDWSPLGQTFKPHPSVSDSYAYRRTTVSKCGKEVIAIRPCRTRHYQSETDSVILTSPKT